MKVGLRKPASSRGGGAFTYEHELHAAMLATPAPWDGWVDLPTDSGLRRAWSRVDRLGRGIAERLRFPAARDMGVASTAGRRTMLASLDCGFELSLSPMHPIDGSLPYATTIWDLGHREIQIFPEMSAVWEWGEREAFYRTVIGRASLIFTGGEYLRGRIAEWYDFPEDRIVAAGFPAPRWPAAVSPAPVESLRALGVTRPYAFYPAQFWAHKNHMGVLRALAAARGDPRGKDLHLVLVGHDYGNLAYVKRAAKELGMSDSVSFLGFVDRPVLAALYQNAVCLLFASFLGPDNIPPLEAMQFDCPVIAARVPGTEEQLGDAAIFVDPADANAMKEAVLSCHADPSVRESLVSAGHRHVASATLERTAETIAGAIERIRPLRECWGA